VRGRSSLTMRAQRSAQTPPTAGASTRVPAAVRSATASSVSPSSSRLDADADVESTMLARLFRFLSEVPPPPRQPRNPFAKAVPVVDAAATAAAAASADAASAAASARVSPVLLLLVALFSLLIRYGVSGFGYSGMGGGSGRGIGGDYEAQRHWMELTVHLDPQMWYINSTQNDLQYWGLDYPPLTAYVSWGFGKLAQFVGESDLVALGTSRGYESITSKYFMRMTVMACDAVLFLPTSYLAVRAMNPNLSAYRQVVLTHLLWLSPPFILIDHGHFQYNCVSLGLVVLAVFYIYRNRTLLAAVAFVLSMCFKQMSLYFAPAFFAYLLAKTRQEARQRDGAQRKATLAKTSVEHADSSGGGS
jgi:hypothetical protein